MNALNLVTHCGSNRVERDGLAAVRLPEATRSWAPIGHDELLEGVQGTLERSGLRVVAEAHALGRGGNRYFGLLQVTNCVADADYSLVIGLRNSHDKSFPAGLAVGSGVFVCDNLAFSAEITLARKHTTGIRRDLPMLIESAVGRLGDLRRKQDDRLLVYKQTEVGDAAAHDLMVRAIDIGVMPVTALPGVVTEWRTPRHPEFCEGRTAWRLFNAFTENLKDGRLARLPRATQALHGLIDTACGLVAASN